MRRRLIAAALGAALAWAAPAAAEPPDEVPPLDPRFCETCHGPDGNGGPGDVPSISGQNEPYLFESLREMRGEYGSSPLMRAILRDAGDDDLQRLARHYASKPYVRPRRAVDAERAERGRDAYLRLCQICHHEDGRSTSYAEYPLLAGQNPTYMTSVMDRILDGQRRVDAIKRDLLQLATRDRIDDAIHYFASRPVRPDEVKTARYGGDRRTRRNRFRTGP